VIGVPVAAVFAGASQYRLERAQQASWHRVPAAALAATPDPSNAGHQAAALGTWTATDGTPRAGRIVAPAGTPAGRRVSVWVDASGRPVRTPLPRSLIMVEAIIVAVIAAAAVSLCLLGTAALARWALTRRRLAAGTPNGRPPARNGPASPDTPPHDCQLKPCRRQRRRDATSGRNGAGLDLAGMSKPGKLAVL
jgi:hypothetical protein